MGLATSTEEEVRLKGALPISGFKYVDCTGVPQPQSHAQRMDLKPVRRNRRGDEFDRYVLPPVAAGIFVCEAILCCCLAVSCRCVLTRCPYHEMKSGTEFQSSKVQARHHIRSL